MDGGAGRRIAAPPHRPARGAAVALAVLSFASVAAGCAGRGTLTDAEILGQERMVTELAPGAAEGSRWRRASAEEASAAADRAEALLAGGDPAGALETIRAAIATAPPDAEATRLRDLRVRARRELVRTALLSASLSASPGRITEGATLALHVSLRNLAPVPAAIRAPGSGESPTLLRLSVRRTSRDVLGSIASETWEESHPVPEGTVGPGAVHRWTVEFDTARFRGRFPRGFVEYEFGGTILPSRVAVGEVDLYERIPVEGDGAVSFPARWEEVAADPAAALERGLRVENPVRVLVAARCAEGATASALRSRLAERLATPPTLPETMRSAVEAALAVLGPEPEPPLLEGPSWSRGR